MLQRCRLDTFQCIYEFGFSPLGAWREAELSVEIVRPDKYHVYTRDRNNVIEILYRLCAFNLDGHDNFIVRRSRILWPIGDAKSVCDIGSAYTTLNPWRIICVLNYHLRLCMD